ncbi:MULTISPECIES: HPr family phosphocarrier protein [unclassified Paenibacillus]|uniref:HPr family phosphocarrier protein n=1 Tax=unclassified Paenibacillus TaxID=185978 RepID=UPI001AE3E070|nr:MULTISPECIES: HPr family phosphocarrier protein [unclassified Paenibacillus]MBP1156767.1 phosphotransferase system HPr (HPr) family protein [Paenibacillus sp. PvP091]MBP1172494.1 phosphotransferase system HPr (HPr) family protein [Paenibacillus sp. PvR098]MBP2438875.1 phosphotransferase system HPr (HPr) family protein [Paenibacillus sp. PvP052]
MQSQTVIVDHPQGFHARPVARWVSLAQTFHSDITVKFESSTIDGKSALGLMALSIKSGAKLEICTSGPDEQEALAALVLLVQNHFQA